MNTGGCRSLAFDLVFIALWRLAAPKSQSRRGLRSRRPSRVPRGLHEWLTHPCDLSPSWRAGSRCVCSIDPGWSGTATLHERQFARRSLRSAGPLARLPHIRTFEDLRERGRPKAVGSGWSSGSASTLSPPQVVIMERFYKVWATSRSSVGPISLKTITGD